MRLRRSFFGRDVLEVAPDLIGTVISTPIVRGTITEVEAYRGEEDLACHARFGKTKRNVVMYGKAGCIYVYFIYGKYWLLNIVTGRIGMPQAVLIRGIRGVEGPGRVGQWLNLDKSFYGEDLTESQRIWIEDDGEKNGSIKQTTRVGVEYAKKWAQKPWRWVINPSGVEIEGAQYANDQH